MITSLQGRPLDRSELIAANASFKRIILGNLATEEFGLYDPAQIAEGLALTKRGVDLTALGLSYCGIVGVVDGVPRTSLEVPLNPPVIDRLSAEFLADLQTYADASVLRQVEQTVFLRMMNDAAKA